MAKAQGPTQKGFQYMNNVNSSKSRGCNLAFISSERNLRNAGLGARWLAVLCSEAGGIEKSNPAEIQNN